MEKMSEDNEYLFDWLNTTSSFFFSFDDKLCITHSSKLFNKYFKIIKGQNVQSYFNFSKETELSIENFHTQNQFIFSHIKSNIKFKGYIKKAYQSNVMLCFPQSTSFEQFEKQGLSIDGLPQAIGIPDYLFLLKEKEMSESENKKLLSKMVKTQIELRLANEELLQFSYRVSHDLKSPLTTTKGLLNLIIEDIQDNNKVEAIKNIEKGKKQIEKLERFVMDLLNFAKSDLLKSSASIINFEEIIDELKLHYSYEISKNNILLTHKIDLKFEYFYPRVLILQIISNCMSNAIKYFNKEQDQPFLKICINNDMDKNLIIKIEDNGIGIEDKNKNKIFEMFSRLNSSKIWGAGLGLYIVHKAIKKLNGTIDYVSSKEGTLFTFKIPQSRENETNHTN